MARKRKTEKFDPWANFWLGYFHDSEPSFEYRHCDPQRRGWYTRCIQCKTGADALASVAGKGDRPSENYAVEYRWVKVENGYQTQRV